MALESPLILLLKSFTNPAIAVDAFFFVSCQVVSGEAKYLETRIIPGGGGLRLHLDTEEKCTPLGFHPLG